MSYVVRSIFYVMTVQSSVHVVVSWYKSNCCIIILLVLQSLLNCQEYSTVNKCSLHSNEFFAFKWFQQKFLLNITINKTCSQTFKYMEIDLIIEYFTRFKPENQHMAVYFLISQGNKINIPHSICNGVCLSRKYMCSYNWPLLAIKFWCQMKTYLTRLKSNHYKIYCRKLFCT